MTRCPRSRNNQSGVALVIVLWLLALLTLLAAGFSRMTRTEIVLIGQHARQAEARASAEAGVWLAIRDQLAAETDREWIADGREYELPWPPGSIRLRLQDEAGRIDLNTARAELLQGLLLTSGIGEPEAGYLLEAIMDWRDRDHDRRVNGAEDEDYLGAGLDHGAKDGPFNSVEELRQTLGMTAEIFAAIEPALTVYSHQPGINPALAPPEVLRAIPGISETDISALLGSREREIEDGMLLTAGADNSFLTQVRGQTIRVVSTGSAGENRVLLDVTVLLSRNPDAPFSILAWRER